MASPRPAAPTLAPSAAPRGCAEAGRLPSTRRSQPHRGQAVTLRARRSRAVPSPSCPDECLQSGLGGRYGGRSVEALRAGGGGCLRCWQGSRGARQRAAWLWPSQALLVRRGQGVPLARSRTVLLPEWGPEWSSDQTSRTITEG